MSEERFKEKLSVYIPNEATSIVYGWLKPYPVKLKITKPRTSKLGDFRVDHRTKKLQISVNGNLNPFAFLVTLTHEVAHLIDFSDRGHLREAHGPTWKQHYSELLTQLLHAQVFPKDLLPAIQRHISSPRAASCSDPTLLEALRGYDDQPSFRLKDLPEGSTFELGNGRRFKQGELRRTRYKCQELSSKKWYLIHGEAEVVPLPES